MEIVSTLLSMVVTSHMWLSNTSDVAGVTKELNFKLYLIQIKFNSRMWLMATMLYSS